MIAYFSIYSYVLSEEEYHTYIEFPMRECFEYIIDGKLEEHRILEYSPKHSFSSSHGIILDEENRRFVVFKFAMIR